MLELKLKALKKERKGGDLLAHTTSVLVNHFSVINNHKISKKKILMSGSHPRPHKSDLWGSGEGGHWSPGMDIFKKLPRWFRSFVSGYWSPRCTDTHQAHSCLHTLPLPLLGKPSSPRHISACWVSIISKPFFSPSLNLDALFSMRTSLFSPTLFSLMIPWCLQGKIRTGPPFRPHHLLLFHHIFIPCACTVPVCPSAATYA